MVAPRTKKQPPAHVEPVRLHDLTDATIDDLRSESICEAQRFSSINVADLDLTDTRFSECQFEQIHVRTCTLRAVSFIESTIQQLDAPVFSAPRAQLRDLSVASSRLGSAELYGATLSSVLFTDCKIGYLNLRGAALNNVIFENCTVEELDLTDAKAQRFTLRDTRVATLSISKTRFSVTDLRGAELQTIVGIESLRGTTMNNEQIMALAELFAAHIGITVAD